MFLFYCINPNMYNHSQPRTRRSAMKIPASSQGPLLRRIDKYQGLLQVWSRPLIDAFSDREITEEWALAMPTVTL